MDNEQIWQAVLGEIELSLSKANFTTWFKNTFISVFDKGKVVVCVPNTFTKAWLEKKYHNQIAEALKSVSNKEIKEVFYKVETKKINPVSALFKKMTEKSEDDRGGIFLNKHGLNNRYVFDNFEKNFEEIRKEHRNEQEYLTWEIHKKGLLKYWPKEWCPSFKYHCHSKIPFNFWKKPIIPKNSKIIIFHGEINPHKAIKGGWGKWYSDVRRAPWVEDYWK